MENKETFGQYIRSKRIEKRLTQQDLADLLYISVSAVSKWERGLSYPDITLISDICKALDVNERELLNASEDVQGRRFEILANQYLRIINGIKVGQYFTYIIALAVCFICNISISHNLSWFFIVLTALMTLASLTLLPLLIEKKRGLITLIAFTISLILLLLTCSIYTSGTWFVISIVSLLFGLSIIFLPYPARSPSRITDLI